MLFNSYSFLFAFLPVVFVGAFLFGRYSHRLAALWLGLASLCFYAIWTPRFLVLLLGSIMFNYAAAWWIGMESEKAKSGHAKLVLIGAITFNLGLLGYYKYANFLIDSSNHFLGLNLSALDIILPLGISFFTFTQIAFLVDVYRGVAREYNFINYLLFVTYFPHLIAGPVLHHSQMMPQFGNPKTFRINPENISAGLTVFVLGLAKKVLIADTLAKGAVPLFSAASAGVPLTFFEAWTGALAYTLQLYFDFSGYCDMAVGISLLFNVKLPINFDSPYKAASIIDFWRRWHMTLSAFLRDYLYIPLGGSRNCGTSRRYVNLMITMLLGGLWHGAGWTFIAWGGLHGAYLIVNHGWRAVSPRLGIKASSRFARIAGVALTFFAVVVGWVFFRADNFQTAWNMLAGMAGFHGVSIPASLEKHVSAIAGSALHSRIRFDGFLPSVGVPSIVFITLLFGLVLVWGFPNLQRLLESYRSADRARSMPLAFTGIWNRMLPRRVDATLLAASLSALLFFVVVLAIGSSGPSEFLYFEF
ncbi:Peptidoglycan O-acetyltransferase [Caballeronia glebae]|uniref:Probable alginate O-acetylase AlgI n=1 Tax=Caballeronia glebae TaxID=1777143 RepID=A0A158AXQ9_9BURK|nr:MBOAT family protein [Caballeronia glebae]SAK62781.1 Peptidoglycan O-acetyltransferase [Caballeronia glebae]